MSLETLAASLTSTAHLSPRRRAGEPAVLLASSSLTLSLAGAAWLAVRSPGGFYLLDTARGPHPRWVEGPFGGIAGAGLGPAGLSAGLIAMLVGYLGVMLAWRTVNARAAWGTIIAANLLFALAPPLLSTDVFGYLSYARLGALHGLNPYLSAPLASPHDALLPFVYWQHATSPYGPLFTAASYPLAFIGPAAGLWTFKAIGGLASTALCAVVSRAAAARGGDPMRAALLIGLNPVVLFYAVGGAHNDLLALLLVAWGVSLAARGHERIAPAVVLAGAAIKVTAGLALPFLVLGSKRPRVALSAAAASLAALSASTLLVFGSHVFDQVRRIAESALYDIAFSGPDLIGRIIGTAIDAELRTLSTAAFLAVTLGALWRVRRGADPVTAIGWATLALLLSIASLAPWYLVWLLPWAAIAHRSRALLTASLALTTFLMAIHLPLLGGVPWLRPAPVVAQR
ncbi:MAG: alpha-(1-_6)-mannopyranosyltransferase A [Thermoleophilaceae bacterium]